MMFLKQDDALAASYAAAISAAITHGASIDQAIAIGSEVQSSLLALLAFAQVELERCPARVPTNDVPPCHTPPHELSWKPALRSRLVMPSAALDRPRAQQSLVHFYDIHSEDDRDLSPPSIPDFPHRFPDDTNSHDACASIKNWLGDDAVVYDDSARKNSKHSTNGPSDSDQTCFDYNSQGDDAVVLDDSTGNISKESGASQTTCDDHPLVKHRRKPRHRRSRQSAREHGNRIHNYAQSFDYCADVLQAPLDMKNLPNLSADILRDGDAVYPDAPPCKIQECAKNRSHGDVAVVRDDSALDVPAMPVNIAPHIVWTAPSTGVPKPIRSQLAVEPNKTLPMEFPARSSYTATADSSSIADPASVRELEERLTDAYMTQSGTKSEQIYKLLYCLMAKRCKGSITIALLNELESDLKHLMELASEQPAPTSVQFFPPALGDRDTHAYTPTQ